MSDHCPGCPFKGCDDCDAKGGTVVAQGDSSRNAIDCEGIKTAPEGASTPTEGLTTETDQESQMATADATPPTGSLAARLDGCPSCIVNAEVPFGAFQPPSGGLVALYKCTDCGHRWHTSWASEVAA